MPEPVVYLNGRFVPRAQATLDVEDRAALFADGVYEVVRCYGGRGFAVDRHHLRLLDSLRATRIELPGVENLPGASAELVRRNGLADAKVYWQVSRGAAGPRSHSFPKNAQPTVLMIAYPAAPLDRAGPPNAARVILAPDERWHRCSIKSLMLLPNVLAMNAALDAGATEAVLHRHGVVTEGTATSVVIVRDGALITHPADQWILPGVTRAIVLESARAAGIVVHEQAFTLHDLHAADEALLCGTTTHVAAVTAIDGRPFQDGRPGPVTLRLHRLFIDRVAAECGL